MAQQADARAHDAPLAQAAQRFGLGTTEVCALGLGTCLCGLALRRRHDQLTRPQALQNVNDSPPRRCEAEVAAQQNAGVRSVLEAVLVAMRRDDPSPAPRAPYGELVVSTAQAKQRERQSAICCPERCGGNPLRRDSLQSRPWVVPLVDSMAMSTPKEIQAALHNRGAHTSRREIETFRQIRFRAQGGRKRFTVAGGQVVLLRAGLDRLGTPENWARLRRDSSSQAWGGMFGSAPAAQGSVGANVAQIVQRDASQLEQPGLSVLATSPPPSLPPSPASSPVPDQDSSVSAPLDCELSQSLSIRQRLVTKGFRAIVLNAVSWTAAWSSPDMTKKHIDKTDLLATTTPSGHDLGSLEVRPTCGVP